MKRRYRRFFVILEVEDKGYERNNHSIKGYAKVELSNEKGSMELFCQNLKAIDEKNLRYRWYLINAKGDKEPIIVDIGPMDIDNNGKGEVIWEFNCDNIKGTGEKIDQFNILALMVESTGNQKELEAPLVGYIDKEKLNWRPMVERKMLGTFKKSNTLSVKAVEDVVEENEEENREEELEIKAVEDENTKPPIEEKEVEEKKENNTEEFQNIEEIQEKQPIEKEEIEDEANNNDNKTIEPQSKYSFEEDKLHLLDNSLDNKSMNTGEGQFTEYSILKSLQDYIEGTLRMFPKVTPFNHQLKDYSWWQIQYNYQTIYRSYMPFIAYIDGLRQAGQYYPYNYPSEYHRQIYMYQHYIFGISYDEEKNAKYYIYGIPGRKTKQEQPYKGSTGFEYWHPCIKEDNTENASGYWLLHIDSKSGKVINPLPKTQL